MWASRKSVCLFQSQAPLIWVAKVKHSGSLSDSTRHLPQQKKIEISCRMTAVPAIWSETCPPPHVQRKLASFPMSQVIWTPVPFMQGARTVLRHRIKNCRSRHLSLCLHCFQGSLLLLCCCVPRVDLLPRCYSCYTCIQVVVLQRMQESFCNPSIPPIELLPAVGNACIARLNTVHLQFE